jgi:hypothetical protein
MAKEAVWPISFGEIHALCTFGSLFLFGSTDLFSH